MKTAWKATGVVYPTHVARRQHGRIRKSLALGTSAIAFTVATANAQSDDYIARAQVVAMSEACPVVLVNFATPMNFSTQSISANGRALSVRLSLPGGAPEATPGGGIETQPDLVLPNIGSARVSLDKTGADPVLRLNFANPISARVTQSGARSIIIALSTPDDGNNCFQDIADETPATPTGTDETATSGAGQTTPDLPPVADAGAEPDEAAKLLAEARAAITAEDYTRAVQVLTKLLEMPENASSADAQELLGVVRERNGQMAHAIAEYEIYLDKYPDGPGADRVRQRLGAILTAQAAPTTLREAGNGSPLEARVVDGAVQEPPRITSIPRANDTFRPLGPQPGFAGTVGEDGSFEPEDQFRAFVSGFYYLNQESTTFTELDTNTTDDDEELLQNAFVLGLDASDEWEVDGATVFWRVNGEYEYDFLDATNSGLRASRLYGGVNFADGASVTLGRQTAYEDGILGRFDGLSATYPVSDDFIASAVVGMPVDSTADSLFGGNRTLFGASLEYLGFGEDTQLSGYVVTEVREGFRDRFALGIEASYFDEANSIFGAIEYAPDFQRFNNVRLNWTRQLDDKSSVSAAIDYRQSPFLSLTAALEGQTATNLTDLSATFTLPQMQDLAKDRSSEILSGTFGYQRQINDTWLASADTTVTYTTGNPASGGVPANPAPGLEFYASAQLFGTGLVYDTDVLSLSGRYANTASSELYLFDTYWRVDATESLRVKPRVRVAHRKLTSTGGYENLAIPSMTVNYELSDMMDFEVEAGDRITFRNTPTTQETSSEFFVFAGFFKEF